MNHKSRIFLIFLMISMLIAVSVSGCFDKPITETNITDPIPAGNETPPTLPPNNTPPTPPVNNTTTSDNLSTPDQISVAAFNLQIFGQAKVNKTDAMDVIAQTIRRYDVVGIQEIRDASGTSLPKLMALINSGTDENGNAYNYDYVVSDRLGRTTSKEQYAYIYDKNTVYVASEPLVYPEPDGTDPFEREPYMVTFRSINGSFDAVFILIHTKPDDAKKEIDELDTVVQYAKTIYIGQDNYVLMGDFNADGTYFNESGPSALKSDEYVWLIGNEVVTTTITNNTYDRIVITKSLTPYFANQSGAFNYSAEYGLNQSQTTNVSDHYPVYAVFWTAVTNWFRAIFSYTTGTTS